MARIAGLVGAASGADPAAALAGMLHASRTGSRAGAPHTERSAEFGTGALGWTGTGEPGVFAGEGVACVLDGAVYNAGELAGPGAGPHGPGSDAALLARLHRRHGFAGALARLNGDFAVALHDAREDVLWVARDRFGVRPLYYAAAPERFAFASRPRGLLALPDVSRALDRRFVALFAASHYRYFDNDPDRSPFDGIAQLPAGQLLRVEDGRVTKGRWWALEEEPDLDDPPEALAERYRELMLDAVALRARRAARPAFTLSGGMDSSSVLACATRELGRPQAAFSTVYAGSEYDETEEIRSMLEVAVERWRPIPVDAPDVLGLVAEMVAAHDEPVATATWLSHHVLCKAVAAEGFDTLFGGLGGDELNAGEYEYFFYRFADLRAAGDEETLSHEVESWQRHHDHPIHRKDRRVMEEALALLTDPLRPGLVRPDRRRLERYCAALDPGFFDLREFEPVLDHPFSSYLENRTYQDLFRETAPCCLRAEDRQTEASGLRNCDPFFDHRLAELMFRVPGHLKIRDGVTKRLLREATRGVLPEETRTRIKKTGWNAPADAWFSGAGREALHDLVGTASFRDRGIYRLDEVRRLIDEHDEIVSSGRPAENHMMFLWQLVNLELWLCDLEADGLGRPIA